MTALALACIFAVAEPQDAAASHMVTVNVKVLEFKDAEVPKELNEDALRKLVGSNKPEASREFQLSTLNGLEARIKLGDEVAVTSGYTATGRGRIQPNLQRSVVGSTLSVVPMVEKSHVKLRTFIEVTRIVDPPKSKPDNDETEFAPAQKTMMNLESTFALQPGKPLYQHVRDQNPKTARDFVIVITATSKSLD